MQGKNLSSVWRLFLDAPQFFAQVVEQKKNIAT